MNVVERRLTKSEQREREDMKLMVLPAATEAHAWHEPALQWALTLIDKVYLPKIAQAATAANRPPTGQAQIEFQPKPPMLPKVAAL